VRRAVDLCRDRPCRSHIAYRSHRSTSTRFRLSSIARHGSPNRC
jgi:hypothetical protein